MRTPKTLLTGLALLAAATLANADTVVRIIGSTAFRGNAHTAMTHIFDSGSLTYGYIGTSGLSKAGKAIFKGTINSVPVTIKTSWTGAVGGQVNVQNAATTIPFLEDGSTTLSAALTAGGTANLTDNSAASGAGNPADVCFCDHFQSSTPYPSPGLTLTTVGVVQFKWLVNNPGTGNPAPFTNITPGLAQALYKSGSLPLSLFTGNQADEGKLVWAIGRDADSGTRLTQAQEAGIGYNSQVVQFTPTIASGAVTSHVLAVNSAAVPAQVAANHPNPGDGGYNSGGTLATVMTATTPNALSVDGINSTPTATGYYVGYASVGDAATALAGGAKELTWNGVAYSQTAVQEGQYTFWGYEHIGYLPTIDATKKSVADKLATQLITVDAPAPLLSAMHCLRSTDGANVFNNF